MSAAASADVPAQPLTDEQYRSLAQFRRALRVFMRFSEVSARAAGITPAQHQLLLAVRGWPSNDPPTIGELAEGLQLKPHSTLELARRAEGAGLTRLSEDRNDRRQKLVRLTTKGERKLAELSLLHRDELRRFRREMTQVLEELD
jgi:DNA-binding MarR family transcriptional regulator